LDYNLFGGTGRKFSTIKALRQFDQARKTRNQLVDKFGDTIDFILSEHRDEAAATAFFKQAIDGIETAHMIRKGQLSEENIPAYKQFMALAG
jgi:transposase-like protein